MRSKRALQGFMKCVVSDLKFESQETSIGFIPKDYFSEYNT